jgi:hypothetical protein
MRISSALNDLAWDDGMCGACIEWGGKIWHRYKGGHYATIVRLHREVWEKGYGPIPEGFHVHHKNGDKGDNRLESLELLSHGEHSARHAAAKLAPHRGRALRNAVAARLRNSADRKLRQLACIQCGGQYTSGARHPTRFCSSRCVEAARSGAFAGQIRKCEHCGEEYLAKKRVQRYCSRLCNARACYEREATVREVKCAQCGAVFTSGRSNARFCGRSCALRFHGGNRFRGKIGEAR